MVMRIISQVAVRPHVLQLPPIDLAAKFRPLAAKMLAWASVADTAPARVRARAIVGWFAAHAVHPQNFLHPNTTTQNLDVLPTGETWASFNALYNQPAIEARDLSFWYALFPNGISMLQKLVGSIAADGVVADDGMLTEYAPGQWRIRNFADFRAVQCTLQCKMAQVVLAAIGIPSVDISTTGHDPMAFYDIEAGRWLYIDPTFGEMLTVLGRDQGVLDLLQISMAGHEQAVASDKLPGASYIPVGYFDSPSVTPGGMEYMTVHTAPQWAGGLPQRSPYRFGALPSESSGNDVPGTVEELMPVLGVGLAGFRQVDALVEVRLRSNWPDHAKFQRRQNDNETWQDCTDIDYITANSERVIYRSMDSNGFCGTIAVLGR